MGMKRPDVRDEDIGMRAFHIRKASAVQRAMERIRHTLKDSWGSLESQDVEELEWALGELWAYIARADWDDLHFGRLTIPDIRTILGFGRELRKHARNAVDVLTDIDAVVRSKN